ncbi:v8-like Glu-specific endopeptidase [Winogradskyella sp. PG-2]|nr:v8-like Glu-specific endopeptidase [Winogradskyella sp. PG-2]
MLLGIFALSLNAQVNSKITELEYPFAAPGTEVSRGVFGKDDRKEIKDSEGFKDFARATAVMINKESVYNNEFYSWSLRERLQRQFGTNRFDENVKFLDQPALGSCTGFLIATDILVTAGHCINSMEDANKFVWVFDYTSDSDFIDGRRLRFKDQNIYEVESIITSKLDDDTDDDYAILRLNRKSNIAPYRFRTSGTVLEDGAINTIGSPTGLPLKLATNAIVIDNSPSNWFKSNIDSFPGNSGGPVFDQNGFIEGILVKGAVEYSGSRYTGDYKYDSNCDCVKTVQWNNVNYTAGCQAHKITAVPPSPLVMAVYENLEYAINNNLKERFNSWNIYSWIYNYNYSNQMGRLENLALNNNNLYFFQSILSTTAETLSDDNSRDLIDSAIADNNLKALKILLNKNLLADAGINSKYTALQSAIINGKNLVVETLIYYGADTKIRTSNGDTLLHIAARNGNLNLVKILLKNGLNAGTKNNSKKRPEQVAKKARHKSLAKYLKKARKGRL